MDQNQINSVAMFETVDGYLGGHAAIWNGFKPLADARAELTAGVALIRSKGDRQRTPTEGITEAKQDLRDALEDQLFEMSDLVSAWAAAAGKAEIGALVEMTRSSLDILSGDDLETVAKRVAATAQANLAALADYQITAANVADLAAKTAAFGSVKTKPRQAIAGKVSETTTLPDAIQAMRLLLRNRVDKLVTKFRRTNAEFVAGYRSARVIVDRPGGHGPEDVTPAATPPV